MLTSTPKFAGTRPADSTIVRAHSGTPPGADAPCAVHHSTPSSGERYGRAQGDGGFLDRHANPDRGAPLSLARQAQRRGLDDECRLS